MQEDDDPIIYIEAEEVSEEEAASFLYHLGRFTDLQVTIKKKPGGKVVVESTQSIDLTGLFATFLNSWRDR